MLREACDLHRLRRRLGAARALCCALQDMRQDCKMFSSILRMALAQEDADGASHGFMWSASLLPCAMA
jgi:hypothetical protein